MTQQAFARHAGTSQSTIAAYESGTKSPTVSTVDRIATSFGLELFPEFYPAMTREDRRSLAFHDAIAETLDREPEIVLARARENLARLRSLHPHAKRLLNRWQAWLDLPVEDLKVLILNPSPSAREMRHGQTARRMAQTTCRLRVTGHQRRQGAVSRTS